MEVVKDLRGLMRQYYVSQRWSEHLWEGEKLMDAWRGEDLEDYERRVEIGSSRKEEVMTERMQWIQLLQTIAPMPGINHQWLVSRLLELYGIRNTDEAFIDQATQAIRRSLHLVAIGIRHRGGKPTVCHLGDDIPRGGNLSGASQEIIHGRGLVQ